MRTGTYGKDTLMITKVHNADGKKIITITDSQLMGKKFVEGVKQLDLNGEFYKGEEKTEEEIKDLCTSAYIIHFVGKQSVGIGMNMGLIERDSIIKIKNIPHAEVIFVE